MNPFERRIIHSALADSDIAETTSDGEEPNRYIVIIPKGVELKDQRPLKTAKESRKRTARKAAEILAEATARISKAEEIRASVNPERKRPKRRTEEFIAVISPSKTIS